MKKQLRSSFSTQGRRMAGARALWAANGMKKNQMGKPIIAIVNSFTQFVPGHVHLHEIGQLVKAEIEKLAAYNFGNIQIISLPHPAISVQPAATDLFALNMEQFWRAAFAGVSQVFLINNVITGILFLIGLAVSSIWAAVFAFVGSIIAICTALILGGGSTAIIAGLFQFSAVLTAIGLGTTFYNPNWRVVCYTFLGTVFTVVNP